MADKSLDSSQVPMPKSKAIGKTKTILTIIIFITVIGIIYGLTQILKTETPNNETLKNEVFLSTTIKLNKTDYEQGYNYNISKGDHIQINFSTTGDSILFTVSNSTFTYISVSGNSWSYLWPPTTDPRAHDYIPSGRYTFLFRTLGNNSSVTMRIERNPPGK